MGSATGVDRQSLSALEMSFKVGLKSWASYFLSRISEKAPS